MYLSILGHKHISNRELLLLSPIIQKDTKNKEITLEQLNCIDDCLSMQKAKDILFQRKFVRGKHKKYTFKNAIDDRIDHLIKQEKLIKQNSN